MAAVLDPANRDSVANLKRAASEAIPEYEKALRLNPDSAALTSRLPQAKLTFRPQ
jgi:hypothetical protein